MNDVSTANDVDKRIKYQQTQRSSTSNRFQSPRGPLVQSSSDMKDKIFVQDKKCVKIVMLSLFFAIVSLNKSGKK
ncbi:MAG: hypothetical protein DRR19_25110 [Candidatus Parabeggiatoa sp. nov. 1]|nr:MAG: hypothetical protein DRR19_25110 [Gammaproteobacteria bacterium]